MFERRLRSDRRRFGDSDHRWPAGGARLGPHAARLDHSSGRQHGVDRRLSRQEKNMNRKQAMLTMLAGVIPWVKLASAAPREDLPSPIRPLPPTPAPSVDELQKQVADLTKRLQAVEAAQARVVGFTKVGN